MAATSGIKKRFLKHLNDAVGHNQANDEKKSLHVTYQKLNGRTVKRKVSPISVRESHFTAYDHKRQAVRSYRLERVKDMKKTAFWAGFEKRANGWSHAAELGGLATLAAPSVQALRGKPMKEHTAHKTELAGLGILAAPTAVTAAKAVGKKILGK